MDVENTTPYKINYKGITYYFCSQDCLNEFRNNPIKYVSPTDLNKKIEVKIVYCRPCKYIDRALNLARDILSYYEEADVELVQGDKGIFDVYISDELIFSRYIEKRFPESEEILKALSRKLQLAS
ncbi:MAG: SelT/SelW/SelH family protein [Sulfolobus sp.]|nr:SelT/SelW/SelH family protein [Sulfolobus sp.]